MPFGTKQMEPLLDGLVWMPGPLVLHWPTQQVHDYKYDTYEEEESDKSKDPQDQGDLPKMLSRTSLYYLPRKDPNQQDNGNYACLFFQPPTV